MLPDDVQKGGNVKRLPPVFFALGFAAVVLQAALQALQQR